jgi:hypothetical protein
MDKLNPVKRDIELRTMWCGPTVIAGITGEPLSKVYEALRKVMPGKRSDAEIKGTNYCHLEQTFELLGWQMIKCDHFSIKYNYGTWCSSGRYVADTTRNKAGRPTLAEYTRKHRAKFQRHAMLINVTGHWTSVFGRRGLDNHCPGYAPVSICKMKFRRSRVIQTWRIVRIGEQLQPDPVLAPPPKPPMSPFVKRAKEMAAVAGRKSKTDFSADMAAIDQAIADAEKNL